MTTLDHSRHLPGPASPHLSTAWMPLDGLIQQWADFGAKATNAHAFEATSAAFAALARETEALEHHLAAWRTSGEEDVTDLEHCIGELHQAYWYWTQVMTSLARLLHQAHGIQPVQEATHRQIMAALEQRMRLSLLIHEVAGEQMLAYRALPAAAACSREEARG